MTEFPRPSVLAQLRAENARLREENERLRAALAEMVYETTHLSPERDDGSHWAKISRKALQQAREALREKH